VVVVKLRKGNSRLGPELKFTKRQDAGEACESFEALTLSCESVIFRDCGL
jgi:hypothetical protein